MALGDAYATTAQYRDSKEKTSVDDDTSIERELKATARYIDRLLGRALGFNQDAADVARVYTMGNGVVLDIEDHASITSVEVGDHYTGVYDTALASTAWTKLPRSAASKPLPEPYRQIEFLSSAPGRSALVRVTGKGGWPSVPDAIVAANIELTGILRLESPRATNRVNEIGQVMSTSRAAQNILGELLAAYSSVSRIFA